MSNRWETILPGIGVPLFFPYLYYKVV